VSTFQLAGAIAGFIALLLSILLNLRQLAAIFDRGECLITSSYHGPRDLIGFASKPRFFLLFENRNALPLDFRHFELLLPRLDGIMSEGEFVGHAGAELYHDGEPTGSRLAERQEFRKIDFLSRVVSVAPHSSEAVFFEFDALLPEPTPKGWVAETRLPADFQPVLQFLHTGGQEFHCDAHGIHPGSYVWPYASELAAVRTVTPARVAELKRGRFLRRWSAVERDMVVGPSGES